MSTPNNTDPQDSKSFRPIMGSCNMIEHTRLQSLRDEANNENASLRNELRELKVDHEAEKKTTSDKIAELERQLEAMNSKLMRERQIHDESKRSDSRVMMYGCHKELTRHEGKISAALINHGNALRSAIEASLKEHVEPELRNLGACIERMNKHEGAPHPSDAHRNGSSGSAVAGKSSSSYSSREAYAKRLQSTDLSTVNRTTPLSPKREGKPQTAPMTPPRGPRRASTSPEKDNGLSRDPRRINRSPSKTLSDTGSPMKNGVQNGAPMRNLTQNGSPMMNRIQHGPPINNGIQNGTPINGGLQNGTPIKNSSQNPENYDTMKPKPAPNCRANGSPNGRSDEGSLFLKKQTPEKRKGSMEMLPRVVIDNKKPRIA